MSGYFEVMKPEVTCPSFLWFNVVILLDPKSRVIGAEVFRGRDARDQQDDPIDYIDC